MRASASITMAALTCDGSCQATVMPGRTPASANHVVAADDNPTTSDTVFVAPSVSRSSSRCGRVAAHPSSSSAMVPAVTTCPCPTSVRPLTRRERDFQFAHGIDLARILEQLVFLGQFEVGQPLEDRSDHHVEHHLGVVGTEAPM